MSFEDVPPGITAALDQRIASISEALDGLVEQARGLGDDDTHAVVILSMAIAAVMAMPQGPATVCDTLALAVRRLATR